MAGHAIFNIASASAAGVLAAGLQGSRSADASGV